MKVAILIYPGFTSLDAVGPFEVFSRLPEPDVRFVSRDGGVVEADQPNFSLPSVPLDQVRDPDLVVVAGGSTTQEYLSDDVILEWIRRAHETSAWTTSVCTGSLLLGAAGLLEGGSATTHWYELESMSAFGASPSDRRVVEFGRVMTSAGVSSGIDMALTIADRLEGAVYSQCIQLGIEYDPQPPHNSGSLATASEDVISVVRSVFEEHYGPSWAERSRTH